VYLSAAMITGYDKYKPKCDMYLSAAMISGYDRYKPKCNNRERSISEMLTETPIKRGDFKFIVN
jgi:hypothetical protein